MSDSLKVSGKRAPLPAPSRAWSFELRPGGWIVAERERADGGRERRRLLLWQGRGRLGASLDGTLWNAELVPAAARGGAAAGGGAEDLVAQFPGKVRKVLVAEGARVAEGDSLLVVEAMKMEFAIKAPFAGRVKRLLVREGQPLSPGDRFLDLEGSAGGE